MSVRYVRVDPIVNLFAPAVRAFGNIAVIGEVTPATDSASAAPATDPPAVNTPVAFSDPDTARDTFPGPLGDAIALAFDQTPGPTLVQGVRVDNQKPDWGAALEVVATLDVQFVMLADTPVDSGSAANDGPIALLSDHVTGVSNNGADGMERMGVAMLARGSADPTVIISNERMVYVAHNSAQDAAAAVAGTIAGYEPSVSVLLKPVNIVSAPFKASDIDRLNSPKGDGQTVEDDSSGPLGGGVNWLTTPALIPGNGVYLGEGYTGNPGGKKYVDIVRFIDDLSFRLKAQLISSIGNVRISRSGLRTLIARMEAVLNPFVDADVLNGFTIVIPVLALLDKDPATLTPAEAQQIHDAEVARFVQVLAAVEYAGAVHRIQIKLKFD